MAVSDWLRVANHLCVIHIHNTLFCKFEEGVCGKFFKRKKLLSFILLIISAKDEVYPAFS